MPSDTLKQQHIAKQNAAKAVLEYIQPDHVLGIGTGSTTNALIEYLRHHTFQPEIVVASSTASAKALADIGITCSPLNSVGSIDLYIDGCDEIDSNFQMIKGGGGALTGEKILAAAAKHFICIADESKYVKRLGNFPIAIEVLPIARSLIARALVKLGGNPIYREGFITDYGNQILDVHGLDLKQGRALEQQLQCLPGVVECGLFYHHRPNKLLLAGPEAVQCLDRP